MEEFGQKSKNLVKLKDLGFNVPDFLILSTSEVRKIDENNEYLAEIVKKVREELKSEKFAVRSNALIEDSSSSSFAGQFKTILDVNIDLVEKSILEVINQARKYLHGDLSKFSLIIQEYIQPDFSGVCFTRNPNGGREMQIEYYKGEGEDLVSGKITPEKISLYSNESISGPEFLKNSVKEFRKIEKIFNFPQDIEWCVKDNRIFILQTRPITTITKNDYLQAKFLDDFTKNNLDKIYKKNELHEICPRPNNFMQDLINRIYSHKGPIAKVYKKYKINYRNTDFVRIIGNEIFVDKLLELQSLFPSYKLSIDNNEPLFDWSDFKNHFITFKNILKLNSIRISLESIRTIYEKLKDQIESKISSEWNLQSILDKFLIEYETIFDTNLLAEKAIRNLENAIRNSKLNITAIEALDTNLDLPIKFDINIQNLSEDWIGNSIDVANFSKFKPSIFSSESRSAHWLDNLGNVKRQYFQDLIIKAKLLNNLREIGRWLTVKNINSLRSELYKIALAQNYDENDVLIFFATIDELLEENLDLEVLENRKKDYENYNHFELPEEITSKFINHPSRNELVGVSSGKAEGKLIALEDVETSGEKSIILYTKFMSPEITQYFGKIKGIISQTGGVLSHLAIMAREAKIPVISNFKIETSEIKIGDFVKIDGGKGRVTKVLSK